jgi:hypothetical protein
MTVPLHQLSDVWSDIAQQFNAIQMNVSDAGHADGSALLDLQMNGISQFQVLAPDNVNPNGGILLLSDLHLFRDPLPPSTNGALALRNGNIAQVIRVYNSYTDDNNYERAGFGWTMWPNTLGIGAVAGGSGIVRPVRFLGDNFIISISPNDPADVGIQRVAPGVMEINSGARGVRTATYLQWGGQARVQADFPFGNTTTLGNIGGLLVNVVAGRVYTFEAELSFTCAAAAGIKCAIGGTCAASNIIYDGWIVDSGANGIKGNAQATALGAAVAAANTTGTAGHVTIRGTIEVSTTGILTVQAAQNTANATNTVIKRGSRMLVHDIT